MISDHIRRLAKAIPIQEETLQEVVADPMQGGITFEHKGLDYFWVPTHTEVQEHHTLGDNAKHMDTLRSHPQHKDLGHLSQYLVEEPSGTLTPLSVGIPDQGEV